jgi:hypothetical protein
MQDTRIDSDKDAMKTCICNQQRCSENKLRSSLHQDHCQSQKLFSGPWPDMMLLEKALANLNIDAIDFISVNSKFSIYFVHR